MKCWLKALHKSDLFEMQVLPLIICEGREELGVDFRDFMVFQNLAVLPWLEAREDTGGLSSPN